jgi:hypothetical protein
MVLVLPLCKLLNSRGAVTALRECLLGLGWGQLIPLGQSLWAKYIKNKILAIKARAK